MSQLTKQASPGVLFSHLKDDHSMAADNLIDALYEYFGDAGYSGTLNEMEQDLLADAGFSTGALVDRWYAYLVDLGYSGSTADMFKAACEGGDLLPVIV